MDSTAPRHGKSAPTVAVIGGGFSGSVFAMKISRALPGARVVVIERGRRVGRGLAYGACAPDHLLNVPVSRMELGLEPGFADWLGRRGAVLAEALAESGGDLAAAFVPREMFGTYLEERMREALSPDPRTGLAVLRGEAVALLDFPARGVLLADGRRIEADIVVVATGNLPPRPPGAKDAWLYDTSLFVPDPWADDAFDELDKDAPVVLLGTGLTMVDVALKLSGLGHAGTMHAISRRGFLPLAHKAGGSWPTFHDPKVHASPLALMRLLRREAKRAESEGVPWQRVMDTMRPAVAGVWAGWSTRERAQFLRHLRPRWDVHRHRMAPRIAERLETLVHGGQLRVMGGSVKAYRRRGDLAEVVFRKRGSDVEHVFPAARVINCTGPRSDMDRLAFPVLADLRKRGLVAPDALGLGIETDDCAALGSAGHPSSWLYALGPLTRPSWWEVVAVPEINAQIDRLVHDLTSGRHTKQEPSLADAFQDLGAGI
ncbi:MAG: FAD/NAD(P)-binding protein [Alphaproteobacteria bacterium]|nr:FAD/NAD(P)-binding protein [Alphaproteobacteria bacterium]